MRPTPDLRFRQLLLASSALLVALALAAPASAVPVIVTSVDLANCDPLSVPENVDELGLGPASAPPGPFPLDEEILAFDDPTSLDACAPLGANTLVTMTNLTGTDWAEVWYVADPETTITNFDGLVNAELAFRIDSVGVNTPLVSETGIIPGVFEAGETWEFIIDDYFNAAGLPASAFGSCVPMVFPCFAGMVGIGSGEPPPPVSSGSIIAIPVPEPSTALLLAAGEPPFCHMLAS